MSQLSTFSSGSGGGGITTINGNTGSITGNPVTIESTGNGTLFTDGSGTVMNIETTDVGLNTAYGAGSFGAVTSGTLNTFMGYNSGAANQDGGSNIGVGYQALTTNVSGFGNIAIGTNAFANLNGANFNVAIGYGAGISLTNESRNIYLGNTVFNPGENGAIHIGDDGNSNFFYAGGINNVNVGSVAKVITGGTVSGGIQLGTATITAGTGITVTPGANTITIDATPAVVSNILTTGSGVTLSATGATSYLSYGSTTITPAEASAQGIIPIAGTLQSLYVNIIQNTSTTDVVIVSRINGVSGNLTVTVPALTVGVFSDLVNIDAIAMADLFAWQIQASTVGTITGQIVAILTN
jgi:hypothetical protein